MELKLYNTLTNKKEKFIPIKNKEVGIYTCGPTVYWYQHIGNLKTYLFEDILKRVLIFNGYKVNHVMNVTDVGHLTSDADEGEDKMEAAAKKQNKSAKELADYYLKIFQDDFKKLNIIFPNIWCKATEHISEQIKLIQTLEKKGFTYKTSDGIYFDTSKLPSYGKLGNTKIDSLNAGKRVKLGEKKNKTDFALWKFSEKKGIRQQEWDSPWGIGFPGWHIECSAMSMKYLGEQFDIHCGGEDHIQIHHTNEIAQSEAATGKSPWVKYWLHGRWLLYKGEKVSKSKGGLYTVTELEKKGYIPLVYRYFSLTTHYRKQLNFSIENLEKSKTAYNRLKNIIGDLNEDNKKNSKYLDEFKNAINNDLDTPSALQVLWKLVRDKEAVGKIKTIKEFDKVLGLDLLKEEKLDIPKEILEMVEKRNKARNEKNWAESDNLRDKINSFGYTIDDGKDGTKVKLK